MCHSAWQELLKRTVAPQPSGQRAPQRYLDLDNRYSFEAFQTGAMDTEHLNEIFKEWQEVAIDAVTCTIASEKDQTVVVPLAWELKGTTDWGDINSIIGALAARSFTTFYDSNEGRQIRAFA